MPGRKSFLITSGRYKVGKNPLAFNRIWYFSGVEKGDDSTLWNRGPKLQKIGVNYRKKQGRDWSCQRHGLSGTDSRLPFPVATRNRA